MSTKPKTEDVVVGCILFTMFYTAFGLCAVGIGGGVLELYYSDPNDWTANDTSVAVFWPLFVIKWALTGLWILFSNTFNLLLGV